MKKILLLGSFLPLLIAPLSLVSCKYLDKEYRKQKAYENRTILTKTQIEAKAEKLKELIFNNKDNLDNILLSHKNSFDVRVKNHSLENITHLSKFYSDTLGENSYPSFEKQKSAILNNLAIFDTLYETLVPTHLKDYIKELKKDTINISNFFSKVLRYNLSGSADALFIRQDTKYLTSFANSYGSYDIIYSYFSDFIKHIITFYDKTKNLLDDEVLNNTISGREYVLPLKDLSYKDFVEKVDFNILTNLIKEGKYEKFYGEILEKKQSVLENMTESEKTAFITKVKAYFDENYNGYFYKHYYVDWATYSYYHKELETLYDKFKDTSYTEYKEILKRALEEYHPHQVAAKFIQWGRDEQNNYTTKATKYKTNSAAFVYFNDEYISKLIKNGKKLLDILDVSSKYTSLPNENLNFEYTIPLYAKQRETLKDSENFYLLGSDFNFYKGLSEEEIIMYSNYKEDMYLPIDIYFNTRDFNVSIVENKQRYFKVLPREINAKIIHYMFKDNIGDKTFSGNDILKNVDREKFLNYIGIQNFKEGASISGNSTNNFLNTFIYKDANFFMDYGVRNFNEYKILRHPELQSQTKEMYNKTYEVHSPRFINTHELLKDTKQRDFIGINTYKEFNKWKENWISVLKEIINPSWDVKTKIKAISHYILANLTYNFDSNTFGLRKFNNDGDSFYSPTNIFSLDRETRCVGYSSNFSFALTLLGIPVRQMGAHLYDKETGKHKGDHAYNEVFVDGRWKVVDLTYADAVFDKMTLGYPIALYDEDFLFMERNDEKLANRRLDYNTYLATIIRFKNPSEYEYQNLPEFYSNTPENDISIEKFKNS